MSIIHVNHIKAEIEKRFTNLIDLSDVKSQDRENSFLTRGLSAFVISELSKADDKMAAKSVVDGFGDNGIDALYFDPDERICYLVTSKWIKDGNGSVDLACSLKFKQGVNDFFLGNIKAFGKKMNALSQTILEILSDSNNKFTLVVAYTGQQALAPEVKRPLEELVSELNDPTELVKLCIMGQNDLHKIIEQSALGKDIKLQIMLKEFGTVRDPYTAFYGQVDLKDIAKWGEYGGYLYAKNLRGFKGNTDVNEGIMNTIKNSPRNFWYFNNGITIVAKKVTAQALGSGTHESRVFDCEGVSVVNGAQTVGSICSAINSGINGLQNSRVSVRIISLEGCPGTFGEELTRAANTQNRIENKDFVALDPQQMRLQTDLLLNEQKRYVYRSGDAPPPQESGCTFEDAAIALACAHQDIANCVLAKREVGKLWEDITKPPYTTLFNKDTNAIRLWRAVEIMRLVEAELKTFQSTHEGKDRLIATHGNRFLLHIIFRYHVKLESSDWEAMRKALPNSVNVELNRLIEVTKERYETSYPSNLFKNLTKCKDLANELAKRIETGSK